jgi:hypothetical protein
MRFANHYTIPATPFNIHPPQPTPDTVTYKGQVITVQKFPEADAFGLADELKPDAVLTSDTGRGPDDDGALSYDGLFARTDSMERAKPFGNRKVW